MLAKTEQDVRYHICFVFELCQVMLLWHSMPFSTPWVLYCLRSGNSELIFLSLQLTKSTLWVCKCSIAAAMSVVEQLSLTIWPKRDVTQICCSYTLGTDSSTVKPQCIFLHNCLCCRGSTLSSNNCHSWCIHLQASPVQIGHPLHPAWAAQLPHHCHSTCCAILINLPWGRPAICNLLPASLGHFLASSNSKPSVCTSAKISRNRGRKTFRPSCSRRLAIRQGSLRNSSDTSCGDSQ